MDAEVLAACRTLMNRDRLRVVGALAGREASVQELARTLATPARALTRHLELLHRAQIITVLSASREEATESAKYALDLGRVAAIAAQLSRYEAEARPLTSHLPGMVTEGSWSTEDGKVLRAFLENGRLITIPSQHGKRLVILRFLAATTFEPGQEYPEKEVNMRLALRHPDVAALRRYLVDEGFMHRDHGVYRLTERVSA